MLDDRNSACVLKESIDHTISEPSLEQLLSEAIVSSQLKTSAQEKDLEERLDVLMQSPPVKKILKISLELAEEQNIEKKEAVKAILSSIQKLEEVWKQILLKEGVESLTTPHQ